MVNCRLYFRNFWLLQLFSSCHGAQSVQVIIAPIFFVASIYISFGNVSKRLLSKDEISHTGIKSFGFIIGDVISFGLQIAGIVLQLIEDSPTLGTALVIIGFVIQIISFGCFLAIVILTWKKLRRNYTPVSGFHNWDTFIKALYAVITLFFVRNIFRLIEYAQGWGGYIFNHSIFVYFFDASIMVIALSIFSVFHPGFIIRKYDLEKRDCSSNTIENDIPVTEVDFEHIKNRAFVEDSQTYR